MGRGRSNRAKGKVRIIAGEWRGRRLDVADVPGLRPSGDRARETLFNWLAGRLEGARCADLFAGSGALGFEAASRGARHVVLVERDRRACAALRRAVEGLGAGERVTLVEGDALAWLRAAPAASLDLAFVDPPFGSDLARKAWGVLNDGAVMRSGGFVYLEADRAAPAIEAPPGWTEWRAKTVGEVRMRLLRRDAADPAIPDR